MTLSALKKTKLKMISLKLSEQDLKEIKKIAKTYADGNVSAWMRYASLNYKPKNS